MAAEEQRWARGLTWRSAVVAFLLGIVADLWMRGAGMLSHAVQLGESVPPIPAIGALILFLLLNPFLHRLRPRWAFSRAEVFVVFIVLSVVTVINSVGGVRIWFPSLTVLHYFATPENRFEELWPHLPPWYGPRHPEVIRQFYEGAEEASSYGLPLLDWILGPVPWRAWLPALGRWLVFWSVFFFVLFCLANLFRRQWTERERLTYPLVQVITELAGSGQYAALALFRDGVFWLGFGLSFGYNILNMLHAYNPSIPALGRAFPLGNLFTERPWNALQGVVVAWRPEIFGLGYLMSLEVTFSAWLFYWLLRLEAVAAVALGYQIPGFPFDREQSLGGYIALALMLLWVGRRHLRDVVLRTLGRGPAEDKEEALSYRASVVGLLLGLAFLLGWAILAGMLWWTALAYFILLLTVAFVYARLRAETGAPMVWLFPFYEQKKVLLNVLGSAPLAPGGNFRNLTLLSSFMWLARGYYPTLMATQLEALRLADESSMRRREMFWALLYAVVLGFVLATWVHLITYYTYGANVLEGGSGVQAGYRTQLNVSEYTELASWLKSPKPVDTLRVVWTSVGFGLALSLIVLRMMFLRFPLHPLGFVMASTYGHPLWAAFFFVWLIKWAILRLGGVRLYRRMVPFFVGIVLGHFFTAGILWGIIGMVNEEITLKYVVHFG